MLLDNDHCALVLGPVALNMSHFRYGFVSRRVTDAVDGSDVMAGYYDYFVKEVEQMLVQLSMMMSLIQQLKTKVVAVVVAVVVPEAGVL